MSDRGTPARPDENDLNFRHALLIAASVMGLTVVLVFLRYAFNFFIDVCILGNRPRLPSWRRRQTQVQEVSLANQEQGVADLNTLLTGMSKEERSAVLETILAFKVNIKKMLQGAFKSTLVVVWHGIVSY